MQIEVGKTSGFCNGVNYTVTKAIEILKDNKEVYCIGDIVHNEAVINQLKELGMITVDDISKVPNNKVLIIRAHGEKKEVYEEAENRNIKVIDLTCGKIKVIKDKIKDKLNDSNIVIIGKKNHPEPLGIKSFSGNNSIIIENKEDINELIELFNKSNLNKIYIVSQTTFNSSKFDELVKYIKEKIDSEIIINNTICNATSNRQNETRKMSKNVNKMIIVGGLKSSNTKELETISKENCEYVYLVQDKSGIDLSKFNINDKVGIMAGASTPKYIVDEIINYLKGVK